MGETRRSAAEPRTVGIDLGATLAKIVVGGDPATGAIVPSVDTDVVRSAVRRLAPERIVATGGGVANLGGDVDGVVVERVGEFEALGLGVTVLAEAAAVDLPDRFLLVSVGTGTSVLRIGAGPVVRVGGTAVGGGTLVGLGRLLAGCAGFEDTVRLAASGDRRRVDLLVGEVYTMGGAPPEILDLTASNFAKLASQRPADLAHAVVGLVGETVALVAGALAAAERVGLVVYCGTTLEQNPPLRQVLDLITEHFGHQSCLLPSGAYCGAVGAAMVARRGPGSG